MNRKISPDMFRESLDRCSSGVHGDPFLAGRIIASGKEEVKMKRKLLKKNMNSLLNHEAEKIKKHLDF